jgi:hypothetical protein
MNIGLSAKKKKVKEKKRKINFEPAFGQGSLLKHFVIE